MLVDDTLVLACRDILCGEKESMIFFSVCLAPPLEADIATIIYLISRVREKGRTSSRFSDRGTRTPVQIIAGAG